MGPFLGTREWTLPPSCSLNTDVTAGALATILDHEDKGHGDGGEGKQGPGSFGLMEQRPPGLPTSKARYFGSLLTCS